MKPNAQRTDVQPLTPEQHARMRSAVRELQAVVAMLADAGYRVELRVDYVQRLGDRHAVPVASLQAAIVAQPDSATA